MLSKIFSKVFMFDLNGRRHEFRSPADLEFALDGRSSPSVAKSKAMVQLSEEDLVREIDSYLEMEQQLSFALKAGQTGDDSVERLLRDLDLSLIEEDNDWRDLLQVLSNVAAGFANYQRVALEGYLKYVAAGQQLAEAILFGRRAERDVADADADLRSGGGDVRARQCLSFSLAELLSQDHRKIEFNRLPEKESVSVGLRPHECLMLMLGKYPFILVSGEPWRLIDPSGSDTRVSPGRCSIGRHPGADINVYAGYRSVSRRHLLIETESDRVVRLTDLSSLGTFAALPDHGSSGNYSVSAPPGGA